MGVTERAGRNRLHMEKPTHKRAGLGDRARPRPDAAGRTLDSAVFEIASALELFSYMWQCISFWWLTASLIWVSGDIQEEVTEERQV